MMGTFRKSCAAPCVISPRFAVAPLPTIAYASPHTTGPISWFADAPPALEAASGVQPSGKFGNAPGLLNPPQNVRFSRLKSLFRSPHQKSRLLYATTPAHSPNSCKLNRASAFVAASRIASEKSTTVEVVVLSLITVLPLKSVLAFVGM